MNYLGTYLPLLNKAVISRIYHSVCKLRIWDFRFSATVKHTVFLGVLPCILVSIHKLFRETWCFCNVGRILPDYPASHTRKYYFRLWIC